MERKVDLPTPFRPMITMDSPGAAEKLMLFKMVVLLYDFVKLVAVINGLPPWVDGVYGNMYRRRVGGTSPVFRELIVVFRRLGRTAGQ